MLIHFFIFSSKSTLQEKDIMVLYITHGRNSTYNFHVCVSFKKVLTF